MTIASLIERLEKATGPDRELDRAIFEAVVLPIEFDKYEAASWFCTEGDQKLYGFNTKAGRTIHCGGVPAFTTSTDDARALIPNDYRLELKGVNDSWDATLNDTRATKRSHDTHGFASNPAIAICIAALRAREAGEK